MALEIVFWAAIGLIVYAHAGYPLLLAGVSALFGEDEPEPEAREPPPAVTLVIAAYDEADVIEKADDNEYGLACGIWTRDFAKAWRVGRAIRTGTVWINTYKQFSISTPFGGEKESGMGREKGRDGIRAYMAQKSIYIDLSGQPLAWAGVAA